MTTPPPPPPAAAAPPSPSIAPAQTRFTQRATLTFVSRLLQYGARIAVQVGVTPIVIHGLGVTLYGAWLMIQQTIGYLAMTDMRPASTL
jgi:hypothetical protein